MNLVSFDVLKIFFCACFSCYLVLGELGSAVQYFNKCMESSSSVCLDRRTTIESAEGLQQAQVCFLSSARSLIYHAPINISLYYISSFVIKFLGCLFIQQCDVSAQNSVGF